MSIETEDFQEETLDQLLNDEPDVASPEPQAAPEPESEPQPEAEPEAEPEAADDENQDESTDEANESSSDSNNEFNAREKALLRDAKAEREKRQAIQRELEELKAGNTSDNSEAQSATIDPVEDPEAYAESLRFQTRVEISQSMMRDKHADYNEAEAKFIELVKENPALGVQMRKHNSPAEFAYNTVKTHERFEQFGSFDAALKSEVEKQTADLEKTLRAKIEKEFNDKLKKANGLPPSGASGASVGSDSGSLKVDTTEDLFG